jgi:hypothetical protein
MEICEIIANSRECIGFMMKICTEEDKTKMLRQNAFDISIVKDRIM